MYYFEIFKEFYRERIKYLITGGLAVNLYGIPRMTMDVDLMVDLNDENLEKLNLVLNRLNYKPIYSGIEKLEKKMIISFIENKNMIAFSFKNFSEPFKQLDILLPYSLDFNKYWINREIRKVDNIEIYLISLEDLIKIKESSNRAIDKSDIQLLKKIKNER